MLVPTTLVGSYPQPEWLTDRAKLAAGSRPASALGTCGGSLPRGSPESPRGSPERVDTLI